MDREQKEGFRRRLLAQRRELAGDASTRTHDGFALGQDGAQDVGDAAANTAARQLLLGLGDRERRQLREIDDALERLDHDTFGFCEECGDEIGAARLQILPHTVLCVDCKATEEQQNPR
ncbi:MAG TPA: TraR/DksA family transcriptional regulator [Deferrisomatales bacterium]|nr:TraR/DksA family transcriptional regulator [Deferrisomatales bacterium]